MKFLDRILDFIMGVGKTVSDGSKKMAKIANLQSQVATCEDIVKKNYMELGRLYYEKCKDKPAADFEKQCRSIKNAKHGAEELKKKIEELKR